MTDLEREIERFHPDMPPSTAYGLREYRLRGFNLQVGQYSYGVPKLSWAGGDKLRRLSIGSFCSIADNVRIYVGVQGRHTTDFVSTYPMAMVFGRPDTYEVSTAVQGNLDVEIGSDVWLGLDTVVLAGSRIGHGACVGTRSLVTGEVPPYAIVGGSPAKVIRYRFDPDVISSLLDLKWWDWPEDRIRHNMGLFHTGDIRRAVRAMLSQPGDLTLGSIR